MHAFLYEQTDQQKAMKPFLLRKARQSIFPLRKHAPELLSIVAKCEEMRQSANGWNCRKMKYREESCVNQAI
jgi:hypothetical protein